MERVLLREKKKKENDRIANRYYRRFIELKRD